MKKILQKYSSLVDRIKEGEVVEFGEMEEVFAKGFLKSYLRRMSTSKSNSRDKIKKIKTLIQALGVKPSQSDLGEYLDEAIRNSNWPRLAKLYGLSREGVPSQENLDKISEEALKLLQLGISSTYEAIRKYFPQLRFTSEMVMPYYEQALIDANFNAVEAIRSNTGVALPANIVNAQYARLIESYGSTTLNAIYNLVNISQVKPNLASLEDVISKTLIKRKFFNDELNDLNKLVAFTDNPKISARLQEATISHQPENFIWIYKNSESKLETEKIQNSYNRLEQQNKISDIVNIAFETNVIPKGNILQLSYNYMLNQGGDGLILDWHAKTGIQPVFNKDILEKIFNEHKNMDLSYYKLNEFLKSIQISKTGLNPEWVEEIGTLFLRRNLGRLSTNDAFKQANGFFAAYGIETPLSAIDIETSYLIQDLNSQLKTAIKEHTKSGTPPFIPKKGINLNEYNKFKNSINNLVNAYASKIKPASIENSTKYAVQSVYENCLMLLISQMEKGDKQVNLNSLVSAIGLPIESSLMTNVLINMVEKYNVSGKLIIDGFTKAGLSYNPSDQELDDVVMQLISRESFSSLEKMLESDKINFPEVSKNNIKQAALKALYKFNIDQYDLIVNKLNVKLNDSDKENARQNLIDSFEKNPKDISLISELNIRLDGKITATPEQLNRIIDSCFSKNSYLKYSLSELAKALNQTLDPDFISKKYLKMLSDTSYSSLSYIVQIRKDTGIDITSKVAEDFLDYHSYNLEAQVKWASKLKTYAGYKPSQERISKIFENAYSANEQKMIAPIIELAKDNQETISGFVKNIVSSNEGLEKKLYWLYNIKYARNGFAYNENEIMPLYDSLINDSLENITKIYENTKILPSLNMASKVIDDAIKALNQARYEHWFGLVFGLIEKGYELSDEQKKMIADNIANKHTVSSLYHSLEVSYNIFNQKPEFTQAQQSRMLEVITKQVDDPAYSMVKRGIRIPSQVDHMHFISDENIKAEAASKAAELLSKDTILQGYLYTRLTGVKPTFSQDQYQSFMTNLDKYISRFNKGEQKTIKELAQKWKVD